jgi:hypothetical protein
MSQRSRKIGLKRKNGRFTFSGVSSMGWASRTGKQLCQDMPKAKMKFFENAPKEDDCEEYATVRVDLLVRDDKLC